MAIGVKIRQVDEEGFLGRENPPDRSMVGKLARVKDVTVDWWPEEKAENTLLFNVFECELVQSEKPVCLMDFELEQDGEGHVKFFDVPDVQIVDDDGIAHGYTDEDDKLHGD